MKDFQTYFELELGKLKGKKVVGADGKETTALQQWKNIGKQTFQILRKISSQIKIQDILGYLNDDITPFTNREATNQYGDKIFIVFDTETTGLVQKSGINKYGKFVERDQIYELAATAYDNDFNVVPDGTLHLKLNLEYLKYWKNPAKLKSTVRKYNSDITDSVLEEIKKEYTECVEGFNFNFARFKGFLKRKFPNKNERQLAGIQKNLKDAFQIERLMAMTKAEKQIFNRIEGWDGANVGEQYKVDSKRSEKAVIDEFVKFINKIKKEHKDKEVVIVAQNLPYDKGMVSGELLDRSREQFDKIVKFELKGKKSLSQIKAKLKASKTTTKRQARLIIGDLFSASLDTQDVFKKLIKGQKKRHVLLSAIYNRIKEASGIAHTNKKDGGLRQNKIEKILDNPKGSVSLGVLGRISDNPAWHTATNDVYVTIQATKNWLATIRFTYILIEIKEGKKSIQVTDSFSITESNYPEFFQFVREHGITSSEYTKLKQTLGMSVSEFRQANKEAIAKSSEPIKRVTSKNIAHDNWRALPFNQRQRKKQPGITYHFT
jgi:hypothetical protein